MPLTVTRRRPGGGRRRDGWQALEEPTDRCDRRREVQSELLGVHVVDDAEHCRSSTDPQRREERDPVLAVDDDVDFTATPHEPPGDPRIHRPATAPANMLDTSTSGFSRPRRGPWPLRRFVRRREKGDLVPSGSQLEGEPFCVHLRTACVGVTPVPPVGYDDSQPVRWCGHGFDRECWLDHAPVASSASRPTTVRAGEVTGERSPDLAGLVRRAMRHTW